MKKIVIMLILSCACFNLQAQLNYLLNGSFEQYGRCPTDFDQISYSQSWGSLDSTYDPYDSSAPVGLCIAEYINSCSADIRVTAPLNGNFYQWPHTGDAMALGSFYYDYGLSPLELLTYIQGRLFTRLTAGRSYCVTFYVNRCNQAGYSVNKIGAYLDDGSIDSTHHCGLPQSQYTPQVVDTNIIRDTVKWTKIQGSFIANGTEKFITLGNFFDTGNVKKDSLGGQWIAAYLVDDVSVISSEATAYAGADTSIRPGDTAQIGATMNGDGMPCWWYVLGNSTAIDSGGTIKVHPASTTTYVVKMELCGNVTYDTVVVHVWPAIVGNLHSAVGSLRVYPNPAVRELRIEGALGCEVSILDFVGREVLKSECEQWKSAIDVSNLTKGIYVIKVTDRGTGESVT